MNNKFAGRLRLALLGSLTTVCTLSITCARAAESAYATEYTTALFAREVQVSTKARWGEVGPLPPRPMGSISSSPINDLLHDRLYRITPSAQSLDVTLSYKLTDMFFLSGGGRFLSDRQPGYLQPWAAKFGADFAGPWLFLNRNIQPISSAEFRLREDHEWSTDFAVRAGLRWGDSRAPNRSLSLMLECFRGKSQSSQMYQQKIDYVGLGLHYSW